MFNPERALKDRSEKAMKKKALDDLKKWALDLIKAAETKGKQMSDTPDFISLTGSDLVVDVSEVQCGDPSCAPIDTVFTLMWSDVGKGLFAIPCAPHELNREDLEDYFPDFETLLQWKQGKRARWPKLPSLRFSVGDRVECRIGPHPVKGWAPGRIIRLYYSEANWPPNMVVPYQIALHDGRLIFAPQDTDQVIRLRPPAAPDAPSSPEYIPNEEDFEFADEDEDEDMEGDEGEEYEDNEESHNV